MELKNVISEMRDASDSQLEFCYGLLLIHIKNCQSIFDIIEQLGSDEVKDAANDIISLDEKLVGVLAEELDKLK